MNLTNRKRSINYYGKKAVYSYQISGIMPIMIKTLTNTKIYFIQEITKTKALQKTYLTDNLDDLIYHLE
jgi:hypothetical protein